MSDLILISSKSFNNMPFDVYQKDDEGWFLANQVCKVLEFGNPRDAIARHVDSEDVCKHDTLTPGGI